MWRSSSRADACRRAAGRLLPGAGGAVLALLCGGCFASAAAVTTTTDTVAAGEVGVPRCATAGIQVFETVGGAAPGVVNPVVINNIDSACAGGTLTVNLNSGGGSTVSASGTVPAGGGSMSLTMSPAPTVVVGNQVDVVIVGP